MRRIANSIVSSVRLGTSAFRSYHKNSFISNLETYQYQFESGQDKLREKYDIDPEQDDLTDKQLQLMLNDTPATRKIKYNDEELRLVTAFKRKFGGQFANDKLRMDGFVTGEIDGLGPKQKTQLIYMNAKYMNDMVFELSRDYFCARPFLVRLIDMDLQRKVERVSFIRVVGKDVHIHPTREQLLNVRFLHAPYDRVLCMRLPIEIVNKRYCPGFQQGSFLQQHAWTQKCWVHSSAIPPFIPIDVTGLECGQSLYLKDIKFPPSVTPHKMEPNKLMCTVDVKKDAAYFLALRLERERMTQSFRQKAMERRS